VWQPANKRQSQRTAGIGAKLPIAQRATLDRVCPEADHPRLGNYQIILLRSCREFRFITRFVIYPH
jgi:hypothetical protein